MFGVDDAIAGGLPILGGIIGNITSSGDRDAALKSYKEAVQKIQDLGIPPELAGPIVLQQFKSAGQLTPELEQAINLGPSQVAQIQEDPATRQASMQALQALQNSGRTGLTAEDRANYNQLQTQSNKNTQATLNSILQNMQARGQGGSGAELAMKLSAAQSGANTQAQAADQVAAQASQRALAAMSNAGNLGSNIRGQDFNVANTKASAADQFNRFNVQNQQAQQQRNVQAQNGAQQYNLSNNQQISNQNTQQNNAEAQRQKQAQLQDYLNKVGYAGMQSNALNQLGNVYSNQAQQNQQMWSSLGGGLGKMYGGYAQNQQNQQNFDNYLGAMGGNE